MDENALIEGILSEPWSSVRRLIYADWLDEHGQSERSQEIRDSLSNIPWFSAEMDQKPRESWESLPVSLPEDFQDCLELRFRSGLATASLGKGIKPTEDILDFLAGLPYVISLDFRDVDTNFLPTLAAYPSLRRRVSVPQNTDISPGPVRPGFLDAIQDWPEGPLRLNIFYMQLNPKELQLLGTFTKLTELDCREAKLNPSHLSVLQDLEHLEVLSLGHTGLEDKVLLELLKLPRLKALSVEFNQITDAVLPHLLQLPQLKYLDIGSQYIQSDPLPVVMQLQNLECLGLGGLNVDDDGFKELLKLPKLRALDLSATKVTRIGASRILEDCPLERVYMCSYYDGREGCYEEWQREVYAFQKFAKTLKVSVRYDDGS